MEHQFINTDQAPAPIGPYNQAVWAGDLLFISGQIAINPADNSLHVGDVAAETEWVMNNSKAILSAAGMDFSHVVKSSIFLLDMGQFAIVNEVYGRYFTGVAPARETVQVSGLPKGVSVEISMIASRK